MRRFLFITALFVAAPALADTAPEPTIHFDGITQAEAQMIWNALWVYPAAPKDAQPLLGKLQQQFIEQTKPKDDPDSAKGK